MKKTTLRLEQERRIIATLKDGRTTMDAIAERTGYGYYTVRRIINDLVSEGAVASAGTIDKAHAFVVTQNAELRDSMIPHLTDIINRRSFKAVSLLELVGEEGKGRSGKAAIALPQYITRLMENANLASHGQDVKSTLDTLRSNLQKDFVVLKNLTGLMEQILQEPKFWHPDYLAKMVDDPDYNYSEVQAAVDYYDGVE